MNPFQFKIPARKKKCALCETPFEDEDSIVSIVKGDEEQPIREDFCKRCFEKDPTLLNNIWGHWETILKKPKKKLTLDQKAMELFIQKHESEEKEWVYFLAHYLKRKKQLILRSELKKEGTLFFEDPITSEMYSIANVDISDETLKTLKDSFIQQLSNSEE